MNTNQAVTIINQDRQGLAALGEAADQAAARNILEDYQETKAQETLRRQKWDIALFETYLAQAGLVISDMATNLDCWSGCTYGLVDGFKRWMLREGYSTGSISVRLATVKSYCELASKHGSLAVDAYSLIRTVRGYRAGQAVHVDETRKRAKLPTRRPSARKAEPTPITLDAARALKQQPDTKKGRRDRLILHLLLDLGLRVGEIAGLDRGSIDLQAGTLTFYRHKVHLWQRFNLERDILLAASAYLADCQDQDQASPLFSGPCSKERLSTRTINARIGILGRKIGLTEKRLSPHDGRHNWVDNAIANGTDIKALQDAGGWSSPAMPLRYAASSKIANAGVKLTV